MLKSYTKGVCAAALATVISTGVAHADNHTVLIMDGGFFPAVSYVKPGDNIIFTNNSEIQLTLAGADSSWVSEPVPVDGTHTLNITGNTTLEFVAMEQDSGAVGDEGEENAEYINLDDVIMEGAMSFNAAPLDASNG